MSVDSYGLFKRRVGDYGMYVLRWIKTLALMKGRDRSVFSELVKQVLSPDNAFKTKMKSPKAGVVIIIITPSREGVKKKRANNQKDVWKMQFSLRKPSVLVIICGCF